MFNFLYSFITLIISLFFIILGSIAMLLPWFSGVKAMIVSFILNNSVMLFLFGLGFVVIGVALASHIILSSRRRYVAIRSGNKSILVSEAVMYDYLTSYWRELLPAQKEIPCRVILKKHKIEITADLPFIPLSEQKSLLERIERDLNDLFRGLLGYREELDLLISFQTNHKTLTSKNG